MADTKKSPPRREKDLNAPVVADETRPSPAPSPLVDEVLERDTATPSTSTVTPPQVVVTQVSDLDSYILERIKGQPATLEGVEARSESLQAVAAGRHRLVLPEFFEAQSFDCTWREGCPFHAEGPKGPYIFRWLFKDKRAIDRALNVTGWAIVNTALFPRAERALFAVSGAVENGDAVLAFIPVKKALEMRAAPGQKSRDLVKGRMTQLEEDYVLMTGDPKSKDFYKPDLPPESVERADAAGVGVAVEGRDF